MEDGGKTSLDIQAIIQQYLEDGKGEAAVIVVKNAETDRLKDLGWDLVPQLCIYLTEDHEKKNRETIDACREILVHLTVVSNVKELLLVLLEQADNFKDDIKFRVLLDPIQHCLRKLPGNKSHSIGISMETLYAHVSNLPLPDDHNLEGKERVLLEADDKVIRITDVLDAFIAFLEPLVDDTQNSKNNEQEKAQALKISLDLTKYLIKLLDIPIAYLDLSVDEDAADDPLKKSRSRLCAEKIMQLLSKLQSDFHQTVNKLEEINSQVEREQKSAETKRKAATEKGEEFDELEHYNVDDISPAVGLSVFCYLAFAEKRHPDCLPQVLGHQYLLEFSMPYISCLLGKENSLIQYKGLKFLSGVQELVPEFTFPADMLESNEMQSLAKNLIKVSTGSRVKELSQTAVKMLTQVSKKFCIEGRAKAYYHLLSTVPHTGLQAYVITQLKDEISANLNRTPPHESLLKGKLHRLLNLVLALPGGEKSDLLDQNERIMAGLNLLRYLVIRDKRTDNVSGIWDLVPHIESTYSNVLRRAIELSRAHYQLQLKNTKELKKGQQPELSFNVGSQDMPGLSKQQQLHVLETAIHNLDLMETVLIRVNEIIEQQHALLLAKAKGMTL